MFTTYTGDEVEAGMNYDTVQKFKATTKATILRIIQVKLTLTFKLANSQHLVVLPDSLNLVSGRHNLLTLYRLRLRRVYSCGFL